MNFTVLNILAFVMLILKFTLYVTMNNFVRLEKATSGITTRIFIEIKQKVTESIFLRRIVHLAIKILCIPTVKHNVITLLHILSSTALRLKYHITWEVKVQFYKYLAKCKITEFASCNVNFNVKLKLNY